MQGQSGTDLIPVTYATISATTVWWPQPRRERMPEYRTRVAVTPTYGTLQVTGNSTEVIRQQGMAQVRMKISLSRTFGRRAPGYLDVVYNGVQYKIQVGATVTVPRIVYDLINQSADNQATIV